MRCKNFGDELDFLALDKEGNLVCIELKHGDTSAREIYWGPIQASVYQDAFEAGVKSREVSIGIERMVRQKVELGLLPESALKRLPVQGGFTGVRGILLIAEPNRNKRKLCFQKLDEVKRGLDATGKDIQVSTVDGQIDLTIQ